MPTVTFTPSGRTIEVPFHSNLLAACRTAGITLPTPCAEKGLCGKCKVRILSGDVPADAGQAACLPSHLIDDGWRAACIVRVAGDLEIADPVQAESVVLSDFSGRPPCPGGTVWQHVLTLPPPSMEDQADDLSRILNALREIVPISGRQPFLLPLLKRLPGVLRESRFKCRILGVGEWILDVLPQEPAPELTGLAIDIGTTTIAVALCRLTDGAVLATSSRENPQSKWGDDVISRVECAGSGDEVVRAMRDAVVKVVEEMTDEVCRSNKFGRRPIIGTVAANPVMAHLFLGVPPSSLAVGPFIPVFKCGIPVPGAELGWVGEIPPLFWVLPGISAFVGGDIVAGMLAHDVRLQSGAVLLLDVGTNGEMVLAVDGKTYACSTAAGPAFEGARISQGVRAIPGAVSRVALGDDGDLEISTIDSMSPLGICGTGLLDAVASLRRGGVIDEYGRIVDREEADQEGVSRKLASRIMDDGEEGVLVRLSEEGENPTVYLTQKDVREFQLAKGAISAGVRALCEAAGVGTAEIGSVLLAGGFGNYLDPASAVTAGLLPAGISEEVVRSVGNSSLAGARLCLLSSEERRMATDLAEKVTHIELSASASFQQYFAEEMVFPDLKA